VANVPAVMVSSTFYDLRQIRTDIQRFLEDELGYRALLSEYSSFPIDPDADTIENCRQRVEQDADILILIIGGRYGSVDESSSKSITNLEYLVARAKGIPVYAFVEKSVLAQLPIWEQNPDVDFSVAVDSPMLFEFVRQVRTVDRVWTYEFERAQDIVSTLRMQFAYLMREGLRWRLQLRRHPEAVAAGLRGKPLRIALEQSPGWEFRLLGQMLCDEVEAADPLRREFQLSFALGFGEHVPLSETLAWLKIQLGELRRIYHALTNLVEERVPEALAPPGTPGDAADIAFVVNRIVDTYRHAIEWALRIRRAHVDECFEPVIQEMSLLVNSLIEKVQTFGPQVLQQLDAALSAPDEGTIRTLEVDLTMDIDFSPFESALEKAAEECF
jgi:hypothetical protein